MPPSNSSSSEDRCPSSAARPRQGHTMATGLRCSQGSLRSTNMTRALRWVVWLPILNAQRTFAFKLLFSSTWWALSPCSVTRAHNESSKSSLRSPRCRGPLSVRLSREEVPISFPIALSSNHCLWECPPLAPLRGNLT